MNSVRYVSGIEFNRTGRSLRVVGVTEIVLEKVGLRPGFEE